MNFNTASCGGVTQPVVFANRRGTAIEFGTAGITEYAVKGQGAGIGFNEFTLAADITAEGGVAALVNYQIAVIGNCIRGKGRSVRSIPDL